MMDEQAFISGYWAWYKAHIMFTNYMYTEDNSLGRGRDYFLSLSGMYLLLWGALLFAVCEYLKKFPQLPPELREEIDKIYKPLRHYRNAVFHIKPVVYPKEVARFLNHPHYSNQATDLHYMIRDFFRRHKYRNLLLHEKFEDYHYMIGQIRDVKIP